MIPSRKQRARWAEEAVTTYQGRVGSDREDILSDLLADLMHWARDNDMDFDTELERAKFYFKEE